MKATTLAKPVFFEERRRMSRFADATWLVVGSTVDAWSHLKVAFGVAGAPPAASAAGAARRPEARALNALASPAKRLMPTDFWPVVDLRPTRAAEAATGLALRTP